MLLPVRTRRTRYLSYGPQASNVKWPARHINLMHVPGRSDVDHWPSISLNPSTTHPNTCAIGIAPEFELEDQLWTST